MTEKPVTTGVFDTLPDAADMPRIMDERITTMPTSKCGRTERHTAHRYGMREQDWCAGNVDVIVGQTDDTRTRAQLNDGCVDGCSCNGSTVTR
jgi:hypothetical protein